VVAVRSHHVRELCSQFWPCRSSLGFQGHGLMFPTLPCHVEVMLYLDCRLKGASSGAFKFAGIEVSRDFFNADGKWACFFPFTSPMQLSKPESTPRKPCSLLVTAVCEGDLTIHASIDNCMWEIRFLHDLQTASQKLRTSCMAGNQVSLVGRPCGERYGTVDTLPGSPPGTRCIYCIYRKQHRHHPAV
jgi:hypothetical protein